MRFDLDDIYIREPELKDKEIVWELRQEFIDNDDEFAGSSGLNNAENFEKWLQFTIDAKVDPQPNSKYVPATQFLTFRKSDNKLLGLIQVRHYLNEVLSKVGGHIGDAIRRSERCKGYATKQIKLALEFCKHLKMNEVLMSCRVDNFASEKTILKNGGVFDATVEFNGKLIKRFWINLA